VRNPGREDRISELVRALGDNDSAAFDELLPLVYDELSALAVRIAGRRDATLQPTALVHEVFLRLAEARAKNWEGRRHFLAVASQAMRQLLADHARRRGTLKRGAFFKRVTLDGEAVPEKSADVDVVGLHEALERLAALDARQARIVEMRYFGGLSNHEIGEMLDLATRTVELDLQMARAFLRRELDDPRA